MLRTPLVNIINMNHELVVLAHRIGWDSVDDVGRGLDEKDLLVSYDEMLWLYCRALGEKRDNRWCAGL